MPESKRPAPLDFYELLEVSPRASHEVIQAAYRALARASHPDRNATSTADLRIRQLNAAYAVLSVPERRARYDLATTRARRHERIVSPGADVAGPTKARATGAARLARAEAAIGAPAQRATEERFFQLTGQVILIVVVLAALAAMALALLWMLPEWTNDDEPLFQQPINSIPTDRRPPVDVRPVRPGERVQPGG